MARSQATPGPDGGAAGGVCGCCGGSGVLRTDSAAYRTCLDCLGQGLRPRFEMVFGFRDRAKGRGFRLSASTSGAR
jgi:hypothetical protein